MVAQARVHHGWRFYYLESIPNTCPPLPAIPFFDLFVYPVPPIMLPYLHLVVMVYLA
jgi:hypothetical protein